MLFYIILNKFLKLVLIIFLNLNKKFLKRNLKFFKFLLRKIGTLRKLV
jgi:hypothetical protein